MPPFQTRSAQRQAMYLRYFALQDHPFAITPDPAFLYLSAHHREALGHLVYGTGEYGGFVQLTGEVGTGKTTLIRALLEQEQDVADVDVALCLNPQLTVIELLASICDELDVRYDENGAPSLKHLIDQLNAHLLKTHAAGRRTVLIIDEAQNLSREVLEQVRLLTNLETGKHKLLRIILVGQPELEDILARPDLRQLAQRITARFHLPGLSKVETADYIRHRLRVGGGDPGIFSQAACAAVYRYSSGTPRLINIICERALMGAYAQEQRPVTVATVKQAARETLPRRASDDNAERISHQILPVVVLVGAAVLAFSIHHVLLSSDGPPPEAITTSPVAQSDPVENTEPADPKPAPDSETKAEDDSEKKVAELPEGDASLSQLLRLWGVFGAEVNAPCHSLRVGELRCLEDKGDLAKLEDFNRPALLKLRQGQRSRKVLLSNLNSETATLVFADGVREWPRAELARLWTGEYLVIWRTQTTTSQIGKGSVGDSVVWLRRRLAQDAGENLAAKAGQPSPVFDNALSAELKLFQARHGLEVDGLVGRRTMITLNNLAPGPGTPLLNGTLPQDSDESDAQNKKARTVGLTAPDGSCLVSTELPPASQLGVLKFSPNQTRLEDEQVDRAKTMAKALDNDTGEIYITGTSYNPTLDKDQMQALALARAQAAAEAINNNGSGTDPIHCIALTGKKAPSPAMNRAAVVYRTLAQAP